MNLGKFMPASFPVPQNPIWAGMGRFVPAKYPVPQNPLLEAMLPRPTNVVAANLTGCGSTIPGDRRGCAGVLGLGVVSSDSIGKKLDTALAFVKDHWLVLAAAAVGGYLILRPKKRPVVQANPRRRRRR